MIILGLDCSLTSPGAVIYDSAADEVVMSGNFKTSPKDGTNVQRADYIAARLVEMCEPFHIDMLVIEEYAFSRPTNLSRLGEVVGVVKLRMWEAGYGVDWVPIVGSSAKKHMTGDGRASKEDMIAAARPWIETESDDIADAFAVAHLAAAQA